LSRAETARRYPPLPTAPSYEIVLGYGRESLARAPDHRYDMIALDAFANDTIPPHLICAQALQLSLDKLTPAGILVLHITNVHVALLPPLAGLAADASLICLSCADLAVGDDER
jgi:spermidine synthase